ncbi:hypothetical protein HK099_002248 [Clydaea vesicula]|uniref:Uncharacterized protein n=1 Tax=Clydaea vesicula TaxID=447962 RepID=A0AAD5U5U2_9FUNG|nr:hypothetical protein HK099_002248 [Clydaea vesicula]
MFRFSKNTSCCSKCHSEDFKVAFDFSFLIFDGTGYLSLKVDSIDAVKNFEEKIYFEILEKIGVRNVPKGNNIFEPLDGVNFDFCVELIALEGEEKLYKLFNTVIYSDFLEELE